MLFAALIALLASFAWCARAERTVDVFVWPLSASKPQTLAQISYNSTDASVTKYTPPKIAVDDEVVRVGFHHTSGAWSGVASAGSNFAPNKDKKLQLYLNANDELYHVGFKVSDQMTSSKSGTSKEGLGVEVVKTRPGPTPHLNKPVVLNAEGKVEEKEPEKSFLQKYWWIFAGVLVVQVIAAMGAKD